MKNEILLGFLILFLFSCQSTKIPKHQTAVSARGVVAAGQPLAVQAGREMLTLGGNAVDAAVATAFALSVVEPSMSGLGGRLQAIIRLPNGEIHGVDATTQSPIKYDTAVVKPQRYGYTTIGIPGVVAGLTKLLEDHGSLPLETVMAPAIRFAEEGFSLLPGEARRHAQVSKQLSEFDGSSRYFLQKDEKPYPAGAKWVQQDLANTLKLIAKDGRQAFYEGSIAQKIVADMKANDGLLTLEDLKNYEAKSSRIVSGSYRGHDLYGLWLPSFGAITIEILQILENFPMKNLSEEDRTAAVYQAMQLAYEDRWAQLESDSVAEVITSKAYAKELAAKIDLDQKPAAVGYDFPPIDSWKDLMGHTTHLSTADESGMMVALTQSLGPNMGSKVAAPGLGFLYAVTLGSYLGIFEPGQRVSSHISPFLVTKDEKPFMGLGAAGGSRIVTAVAQVVSRVIDQEMPVEEALAAPRVFPDQDTILLETHAGTEWSRELIKTLKTEGFGLKSIPEEARFGRVHAVLFDAEKKKWIGAADPDWEGVAGAPKKK